MKACIYADNAATTKLDREAFESMIPWLTEEYGNPSQPYSFSRPAKKALADAREIIALCINASPDEIFFTSGGTESDNWAIKGVAHAFPDKKRIVTSPIEHHAVLNACNALFRQGFKVDYVCVNSEGTISQSDLHDKLCEAPTAIVSIMMANNEIGTIQPLTPETETIVHSCGALFHTDAVQAVGHIPIDTKKIGVDLLSASAHKFNGPKGVGFLYIKKGTRVLPYLDGGSQERDLRAGTENIASIVGMATALKRHHEAMTANAKHILDLSKGFITKLEKTGIEYKINGSSLKLPGLLSISFPGFDGETILHRLDLMGICISTGAACDSKSTKSSHVLKAIKLEEKYANGTIRISFGKDNTEADSNAIIDGLVRILKQ